MNAKSYQTGKCQNVFYEPYNTLKKCEFVWRFSVLR